MQDSEMYDRTRDSPSRPAAGGPSVPNEPYYQRSPEQRRGARLLGVVLVAIGLVWLIFALQLPARVWPASSVTLVDQTLPGSRLDLTAVSGDVEIRPWDRQEIRVEVTQRGAGRGDVQVGVRQEGDTVRVTTDHRSSFCIGFCWNQLNYRVSLPEGAEAQVRTTSGDVAVAGSGALTIATVSGDVELRDIRGPLSVQTTSGDVELRGGQVRGATVQTISGDVTLEGVSDSLEVQSVSGDITARDGRDARLTLNSTSGDVEYAGSLSRAGDSRVNTLSGNVQLRLPPESSFRLNASSFSGDIASDFELREAQQGRRSLQGVVGDGGPLLTIETTSGDVSISRR